MVERHFFRLRSHVSMSAGEKNAGFGIARQVRSSSDSRVQMIDVTGQVNAALEKLDVGEGLCNLFVPHTTAAIIVSENWDPDVVSDMTRHLEKLVPREAGFKHGEGNSQAHILSVMLSTSINIPIHHGKLRLGRWQGVMFAEFDGPRERALVVSAVPAAASA